jgi:hypothetical protein
VSEDDLGDCPSHTISDTEGDFFLVEGMPTRRMFKVLLCVLCASVVSILKLKIMKYIQTKAISV